ncbi:claudin-18-like isoform X1 [Pangasianodon hypophthalmus]|uniref:claudin-18-like isoform X1 n=1 Tax=Pangasianodon hypophthalmus TaxID=310915 RepID=UPI000EFEB665|nr:claudin-18-like isoform X1 [Pangasianodon hypophthalmus]
MAVTMCQVMGFVLGLLGLGGIIASTAMDMWSTEDLYDNPVTSVYSYAGLWRSCVRQSSGFTECRPYFTILGLPGLFQGVRALMIVAIVLGVIGVLIAIFALKCLRMGNMEDRVKATMTLTSGVMFVIAGICSIAGVSIFANLIVTNFALTTYTSPNGLGLVGSGLVGSPLTPRYTFGSALFVGWVGGGVLFIGGILLCLACRGLMPEKRYEGTAYKPATQSGIYRSEGYPKTYNSSYKAHSIDGRQSNQRFDYV